MRGRLLKPTFWFGVVAAIQLFGLIYIYLAIQAGLPDADFNNAPYTVIIAFPMLIGLILTIANLLVFKSGRRSGLLTIINILWILPCLLISLSATVVSPLALLYLLPYYLGSLIGVALYALSARTTS